MWISKKKYKEDLEWSYLAGEYSGRLAKDHQQLEKMKECNKAILKNVLEELAELDANTWDKERVARIRKILITGLS